MVNLTTYGEFGFVDPKEFFIKTKEVVINLTRVLYDSCNCNLVSKLTGKGFRELLDYIKEENDGEDEYIMIFKTKEGYLIRQEVRDELGDEFVNEWEVIC